MTQKKIKHLNEKKGTALNIHSHSMDCIAHTVMGGLT
jgi:hypothetical protein